VAIEARTPLGIPQHLICGVDLLEFRVRLGATGIAIRVMLARQPAECGFDFITRCLLGYAENSVRVAHGP
jgi:hypothetical protein